MIHILNKRSGRFRLWKVGSTKENNNNKKKKAPLLLGSAHAYQIAVRILVRGNNFGGNMIPLKPAATSVNFSAQREAKGVRAITSHFQAKVNLWQAVVMWPIFMHRAAIQLSTLSYFPYLSL